MIRSIGCVLFVALAAMLAACGGASTTVQPTQGKRPSALHAGKYCVRSDPEKAPFTIRNRDLTLKASGVANDPITGCFALGEGWYEVTFGKVVDYPGTPPPTGLLELKNGLRFDIMADYSGSSCADDKPILLPTQVSNEEIELLVGEICANSNVSGAPFVLSDRDRAIEVTSVTYACAVLQTGEYEVEFKEVKTFSKPPQRSGPLELLNGVTLEMTGYYAE